MSESVLNVKLDVTEAEALCSIVHPILASILNKEGLNDIITAIKERNMSVFENMTPLGQCALVASIAICKVEMELKSTKGIQNEESTARA